MKKLFSFMLMATALLISGQMKAVDWESMPTTNDNDYDASVTIGDVTKYCSLTDAFAAVNGKTATIEMLKTPEKIIGATKAGTRMTFGANTDLTWNLTGQTIDFHFYGFDLKGAKVNLTGEGTLQFTGQYTDDGDYKEDKPCTEIYRTINKPYSEYGNFYYYFQMYGTTNPESENYSVLTIGRGVTISSSNEYGYGVQIARTEITPSTTPKTYAAYGVVLDIYGEISAAWGVTTNGYISGTGNNVPKIIVEEGAQIVADECSNGIYAAGVANFEIYGTVAGGTGIYAKAGSFLIDGATVMSTADSFEAPTKNDNGTEGGLGVAIVFDSNSKYAGGMSMTITGESQVIGTNGWAIFEGNTSSAISLTKKIEIQSGTFVGGEGDGKGCINMTTETKEKVIETQSIKGGTYSSEEIREYLGTNGIIIPVVKGDETVYVVAQNPNKTLEDDGWVSTIAAAGATDFVKIAADEAVAADKTIAYLSIPGAYKVTVKTGAKLSVGEIVLSANAVIEVEAGGKLVVNGTNGLIAFEPENLVLKAGANSMATFAFNPAVKANKTPWATVEYYTTAHKRSNGSYRFDIFSFPFVKGSITEITKSADIGTNYQHIVNGAWKNFTNQDAFIAEAEPFESIAFTNNGTQTNVTYTFKGQLQGNISGKLSLKKGFNYIGNPYMAPMTASELIKEASAQVSQYISMWNGTGYTRYNDAFVETAPMLKPMNMFVLWADEDVEAEFNYETLIWNNVK